MMDATFSVYTYDQDGDVVDESIFIHLDDGRHTLRFDDLTELGGFIKHLTRCRDEIASNAEEYGLEDK